MKRTASANWKGGLKDGQGTVSTTSGVLSSVPYNFSQRFETGAGTSPEELIAAAWAACFAMALSAGLARGGTPPERLATSATVTFQPGEGIIKGALTVRGTVPGIDAAGFESAAQGAKENCPVSMALTGIPEITLDAALD